MLGALHRQRSPRCCAQRACQEDGGCEPPWERSRRNPELARLPGGCRAGPQLALRGASMWAPGQRAGRGDRQPPALAPRESSRLAGAEAPHPRAAGTHTLAPGFHVRGRSPGLVVLQLTGSRWHQLDLHTPKHKPWGARYPAPRVTKNPELLYPHWGLMLQRRGDRLGHLLNHGEAGPRCWAGAGHTAQAPCHLVGPGNVPSLVPALVPTRCWVDCGLEQWHG